MAEPLSQTVSLTIAEWLQTIDSRELPAAVTDAGTNIIVDTIGLSIAAKNTDYVAALKTAWPGKGPCTVFGVPASHDMASAAMINGTAAHGEDFDTTFEGCPVHAGAVVVPAVIAAGEQWNLSGTNVSNGIIAGTEIMCRLGLIAKKGIHAAGFHPTAVLGTMAATVAVATATGSSPATTVNALGIAGSMASGIIEYLADGTWTKRMHAGWAAQSGLRAVAMAQAGFRGPATVFEGEHGLFNAFAPSINPDFTRLTADLGEQWHTQYTAFKPYACGTMTQPFVDCAIRLARTLDADDIVKLTCKVGEGTVRRLWEPLTLKQKPPNGYASKFSTPYCVAVAFLRGDAGLAEFDDNAVHNEAVIGLAKRVEYEIDPDDAYPLNYTGRVIATLADGTTKEAFQPHLRGGSKAPLSRDEILRKCAANICYGGFAPELADQLLVFAEELHTNEKPVALSQLQS
jgi:2-methylcitrate dehydratase PrpD